MLTIAEFAFGVSFVITDTRRSYLVLSPHFVVNCFYLQSVKLAVYRRTSGISEEAECDGHM